MIDRLVGLAKGLVPPAFKPSTTGRTTYEQSYTAQKAFSPQPQSDWNAFEKHLESRLYLSPQAKQRMKATEGPKPFDRAVTTHEIATMGWIFGLSGRGQVALQQVSVQFVQRAHLTSEQQAFLKQNSDLFSHIQDVRA